MSEFVQTREHCEGLFQNLHNLLWNEVGLSPEKAISHLMLFFSYRLIEPQVEVLNLPQECRWSYVASLQDNDELFDVIEDGIKAFRATPTTEPFFLPKHSIKNASILAHVVREINKIGTETLAQLDILSEIFEYMLSRGMATTADNGQYFTNRAICRLAFDLAYEIKGTVCKPDGTLCTFADFFCGTGGFPSEYVRGVNRVEPGVDWIKESAAIYCCDKDDQSITTTLLNMLILTGIPFDRRHIVMMNSFRDNITRGLNPAFPDLKVDYGLTNPPYGGDKTKGREYRFAYSKKVNGIKEIHVNADIQSIGIEDDDKVLAGVQLAMATLADGGVQSIVLPRGFFTNTGAKVVQLRRLLAEEYRIHYVADIASGAFNNTGAKTSLLVFQKGVGPTEMVKFIDLDKKVLLTVDLEQLRERKYFLRCDSYIDQDCQAYEGFEWTKLGDIIEVESGSYITKAREEKGKYPVYGGGGASYFITRHNRESTFVIGKDGVSKECVRFVAGKFFLNHHGWTLKLKGGRALVKYVGYWLIANQAEIYKLAAGTAQKGINQENFYGIKIPLPSLDRQREIARSIDVWADLTRLEQEAIKCLEWEMMFEVGEMARGQPKVKLGEVLEFQPNKNKYAASEGQAAGKYPFYSCAQKLQYSDHCEFSKLCLIINGGGFANIRMDAGFAVSNHIMVMSSDDENLVMTIYYYLKNNIKFLESGMNGTTISNISKAYVNDLMIRLPGPEDRKALQSFFTEIRHKYAQIVLYKAKMEAAVKNNIPGSDEAQILVSPASSSSDTPRVLPVKKPALQTDINSWSRTKVNARAKELGLKGYSSKSKSKEDVIGMIREAEDAKSKDVGKKTDCDDLFDLED